MSARLISEFERGIRTNFSLDTAIRLLQLVDKFVTVHTANGSCDENARAVRAEHRRRTFLPRPLMPPDSTTARPPGA